MSDSPDPALPTISVVVLAYGDEPVLVDCVHAILASERVLADVVLVDNGCTSDAVERLTHVQGVTLVRPHENTGFAGGSNLGAAHSTGDHLGFVNGDAITEPGALAALVSAAREEHVGLASASLRMLEDPRTINSAGNPVHYLGLSWAGGLGDPASAHTQPADTASCTGAAMVCRRAVWERLGGFSEDMFAYCEDADLSLRSWQLGLSVRYVPEAVVLHRYEFSRNNLKMYLVERNRLFMLLTLYERRTLLVLLPALLGLEVAVLGASLAQGWWRQKVRGWCWLLRHRRRVLARRRQVQQLRRWDDRAVSRVLTATFAPGVDMGTPALPLLNAVSQGYWRLARPLL